MAHHDEFTTHVKNYLDDKGLEHEVKDGRYNVHVKIRNVTKKFYLEVILPEIRTMGTQSLLDISGTTYFSNHMYVRFFGRP